MYRNDVSPLDGLMLGRLQREVANFTSFFQFNFFFASPSSVVRGSVWET